MLIGQSACRGPDSMGAVIPTAFGKSVFQQNLLFSCKPRLESSGITNILNGEKIIFS